MAEPSEPRSPLVWWSAIGVLIALIFMTSGLFVGGLAFGSPEIVHSLVTGRVVSRALVLFLIVPSVVLLTATGKISGEAALAALSSTGGYVLGEAHGGGD